MHVTEEALRAATLDGPPRLHHPPGDLRTQVDAGSDQHEIVSRVGVWEGEPERVQAKLRLLGAGVAVLFADLSTNGERHGSALTPLQGDLLPGPFVLDVPPAQAAFWRGRIPCWQRLLCVQYGAAGQTPSCLVPQPYCG